MKKILIAYPEFYLGGSTTSLISLLNTIDYSKYKVDLIVYKESKEIKNSIPKEVNFLGEACRYKRNNLRQKIIFLLRYILKGHLFKAVTAEIKYNKLFGLNKQVLSKIAAKESTKLNIKYDVAIGYLEYWANDYIINHIDAGIKIAWIHTDYIDAKLVGQLDFEEFNKVDKIIFVSLKCLENFKLIFPELSDKLFVIENIISQKMILKAADEIINDIANDSTLLKVITVCRLDIFTKGIDRIIDAVNRINSEGYNLKWYIIGDGPDLKKIEGLIESFGLTTSIILLGKKSNPFPYVKQCDLFCMPSRFEGKPIAVTEAQILGLPVLITNYSSAKEQVNNNIDGIIIENNDTSLYYGLKNILKSPQVINDMKKNISKRRFDNESEITKLYSMID